MQTCALLKSVHLVRFLSISFNCIEHILNKRTVFLKRAVFARTSTKNNEQKRVLFGSSRYIYIYYFYFVFIPLFLPSIAQMKESLSFCLWNFDFAWTSFLSFHFFVLFCVGVCYLQLDMANGFCDVPYWCAESESIGSFVPVVHVLLRGLLSLLQKDDLLQGAFGTQANFPHIYHLWCLGWKPPTISKCLICVSATGKPHPKTTFSPPKSFWMTRGLICQQSSNNCVKQYQTQTLPNFWCLENAGMVIWSFSSILNVALCFPLVDASQSLHAIWLNHRQGFSCLKFLSCVFKFGLQAVWRLRQKANRWWWIAQKQVGDDGWWVHHSSLILLWTFCGM